VPATTKSIPQSSRRTATSSGVVASVPTGTPSFSAAATTASIDVPEHRRVELAEDPEARGEVSRTDEQRVQTVEGGDLVDVVDGARGLYLEHRRDRLVSRLDVLGEVAAVARRPATGDAPDAVRRVVRCLDRVPGLAGGVDLRDDDAGDAEVEDAPDVGGVRAGDADDRVGTAVRRLHGAHARCEVVDGVLGVFAVQHHEVEGFVGEDFGDHRVADGRPRADRRVARAERGCE